MKKIASFLPLLLCGFMLLSCKDDSGYIPPVPPPDTSLAGSILMDSYPFEATGTFDNFDLTDFQKGKSSLNISKKSDTQISLTCYSEWSDARFSIDIPEITLSGTAEKVSIDYTSHEATVLHNDTIYQFADATVKGWASWNKPATASSLTSRSTPALRFYTCDITIQCEIGGKPLILKITSAGYKE